MVMYFTETYIPDKINIKICILSIFVFVLRKTSCYIHSKVSEALFFPRRCPRFYSLMLSLIYWMSMFPWIVPSFELYIMGVTHSDDVLH